MDDVFARAAELKDPVGEPIGIPHVFFRSVQQRPAFLYGIFNPMGPTWNLITLASRRGQSGSLLCHRMLNPFSSENMIWASVPRNASEDNIVGVIVRLFATNGADEHPLIGSMPTWLLPADNSSHLSRAMEPALREYVVTHAVDLRRAIAEFREYLGRPWDRLTADQDAAREFVRTHPLTGPGFGETEEHAESSVTDTKAGAQFDEWFRIMLDPRHAEPEIAASIQAWDGAIEFQGEQARTMFPDLMTREQLMEALSQAGL